MKETLDRYRGPHVDRQEYQPCDKEELEIMTDMIDELLISNQQATNDYPSISTPDSISRSFTYMESGLSSGWMWPLTETDVKLTYTRDRHPSKETYQIEIAHTIHQKKILQPPLVTICLIEYFGKNNSSYKTTIETIDTTTLEESNRPPIHEERHGITFYDCREIYKELSKVWDLIDIQDREQMRLNALD